MLCRPRKFKLPRQRQFGQQVGQEHGQQTSLTIIQIEASGFPPKFSKNFRKFFEIFLYKSFVCSFARSFENFSNFSSRRRDRFGPKIVKFRAILAIFRPFEDFEFETAPKRSIWIRFELQGPPKGPAARIEFKCYSLVGMINQKSRMISPSITIIQIGASRGFGDPASLSSFKRINRKRDDILRWVPLSSALSDFEINFKLISKSLSAILSAAQRKMSSRFLFDPFKGRIGNATTFCAEFCWAQRWAPAPVPVLFF